MFVTLCKQDTSTQDIFLEAKQILKLIDGKTPGGISELYHGSNKWRKGGVLGYSLIKIK